MKEILGIINPVRVLKVEDWINISQIVSKDTLEHYESVAESTFGVLEGNTIMLMKRYELLTSQELLKEMFVCDVIEPKMAGNFMLDENKTDKYLEWKEAQSKVWFDGFEVEIPSRVKNKNLRIYCGDGRKSIYYETDNHYKIELGRNPAIYDLIIEIDRYNRTATEKIKINFTENFVKHLIQ